MTKRRLPVDAPLPAGTRESLLRSTEELLGLARRSGMRVMHVLSALRPVEAAARAGTKFYTALAEAGASPSPYGPAPDETVSVQDGTFKPDLIVSVAPTDFITKTKKSMSAFYQTDIERMLTVLGCDTVILAGLHTNADIISTAYEASNRGLKVVTIRQCVATMYGDDLQMLGLEQLGRCQGWCIDLGTLAAKIGGKIG